MKSGLSAARAAPAGRGREGARFVTLIYVTSHANMDIFGPASGLTRNEEDDEVKQIISNIGR